LKPEVKVVEYLYKHIIYYGIETLFVVFPKHNKKKMVRLGHEGFGW
jgi:hypothetical protein